MSLFRKSTPAVGLIVVLSISAPNVQKASAQGRDADARESNTETSVEESNAEQDRQQRTLEALVQHRKFDLAESFCQQQITALIDSQDRAVQNETNRQSALWASRWISVLTEKSRQVPTAERVAVWTQAACVAEQFGANHAQNAWISLVHFQAAMACVARAEATVLPSESGLTDTAQALIDLRAATKALTQLELELEDQLRTEARSSTIQQIGGPSQREFKSLRARVYDSLGQVYLYQSRLYGLGTPDQLGSCQSAIRYFDRISPLDVPADVWDEVRIRSIEALRRKRDFSTATTKLDRFLEADTSTDMKLMARAEQIRLALAQDDGATAQSIVTLGREIDGHTLAELDIARLETMLHEWHRSLQSQQNAAAQSWREKAGEIVALIERDHSPYWLHRAETLLASIATDKSADDVELLERAAKNLYLRGELDVAIAAYDQAYASAAANRDDEKAFELAFQAAAIQAAAIQATAIQDSRDLHDDARNRFRAAALRFPTHPNAPRAHEMAILKSAAALQNTQFTPTELAARITAYQKLLIEHIDTWPHAPASDRARLWLAKLYERQRRFDQAAETFSAIRDESLDLADVVRQARACYVQSLSQAPNPDQKLRAALMTLNAIAAESDGSETLRREATVLSAELQLRFATDLSAAEFERIVLSLESLLQKAPTQVADDPNVPNRVSAMIIATLARSRKWDLATEQIESLQNAQSKTWFELLSLLSQQELVLDGTQHDLGQLQLVAIERLRLHSDNQPPPEIDSPDEAPDVVRWKAEALLRTGDFADALVTLQPLVQRHSDDLRLREAYAQGLLASDDASSLNQSLEQWRFVLKRSPLETIGWFRAKYAIALGYRKLGQTKRAAEMIRLLQTLHPELGGNEMRLKFQTLLAECEQ